MNIEVCLILSSIIVVSGLTTKSEFWKGTPLDSTVEKIRLSCAEDNTMACFEYKAFWFLNSIIQGDYFQLPGKVEITRNNYRSNDVTSRSDRTVESIIQEAFKSYNVKFDLPTIGSVTVDSRSLDSDELDINFDFSSGNSIEARKKSKLKKIFVPILVIILLKVITLIPFALGVLGFKAWNSLQLAFFSFIISTGIAIFQLCQKLSTDNAHAHITSAHGPWDATAVNQFTGKSISDIQMAYSKHYQQ